MLAIERDVRRAGIRDENYLARRLVPACGTKGLEGAAIPERGSQHGKVEERDVEGLRAQRIERRTAIAPARDQESVLAEKEIE